MDFTEIPTLIDKSLIAELTFKKTSIQPKPNPEIQRKISDAMLLGNAYHTKVSIIFYADEGMRKVNTTIWAVGSRYLCLKGGMWIPIGRILEIELI